jgi:cob(I)alamin adenosyltransferase
MTAEKKEHVQRLETFIDNYNGELKIKQGKIYEDKKIVATFKGNKAVIR